MTFRNRILLFLPATLWILFYLIVLDVAINLLFPYPKDPRNISPSIIQQHFEYGRSTEGKFARMTRETDDASAPIVSGGWLENGKDLFVSPDKDRGDKPVVTVYGMSHANLLAQDLAACDPTISVRFFGAPGGVPSFAFTAHRMDRTRFHSDVAILAVMTEGAPVLSTTSGATMFFEFSYPYTYPRYYMKEGRLECETPPFLSVEGYRAYFFDKTRWSTYVDWLDKHDKFYDPLLFRETILDRSSLIRLLRRSYAKVTRENKKSSVYNKDRGFDIRSEEVSILKQMVIEFARNARSDGSLPIVYIVNNLNTGDRMYRLLEPVLSTHDIPFLSSHTVCSPDDPAGYLPDSHFIPSKNRILAQRMSSIIHDRLTQ